VICADVNLRLTIIHITRIPINSLDHVPKIIRGIGNYDIVRRIGFVFINLRA